jgi:hypothetical protein
MITRRSLVEQARTLPARSTGFDAATAAAGRELVGMTVELRHRPRVLLPRDAHPAGTCSAAEEVERLLPGMGPEAVIDVLLRAQRTYELRNRAPRRTIAFLGSFWTVDRTRAWLVIARLIVEVDGKRAVDPGAVEVDVVDLANPAEVHHSLETLAAAMVAQHLSLPNPDDPEPRSVTIIGGSKHELGDDWQLAVRTALWAYGLTLEDVFEQPWRREPAVSHRLSQRKSRFNLALRHWCRDDDCHDRTDEFTRLVDKRTVIDTENCDSLEAALGVLRMHLDNAGIDAPPPGFEFVAQPAEEEPAAFVPSSWKDVYDNLWRLQTTHFRFTDRARRCCRSPEYADFRRMWLMLETLSRIATAWARARGSVGKSFTIWARENYGLEIAMSDKAISDAKADTFTYASVEHSRLPHVKVDDAKAFTECGRIYFARDTADWRFIVDHIGLHLLASAAT